jgi:uncharacterized repeat protein (TIGR04138 family)
LIMQNTHFHEALQQICEKDSRYDIEAYLFIREALDFTVAMLKKPSDGPSRHVSGKELLDGIRDYAVHEFGPMALTVLDRWGVKITRDFGEIVFNLVEAGLLGKTESDRKEDFDNGYDFHEAFAEPFLPKTSPPARVAPKSHRKRSAGASGTRNSSGRDGQDEITDQGQRGKTDK